MRKPRGKRIVLTRSAEDCADWARRLEALGYTPVILPCIDCEHFAGPVLGRTLTNEARTADWLIFTSRRGVEAFASLHDAPLPSGTKVAAVGEATAAAARTLLGRIDLTGRGGTAAALADDIQCALAERWRDGNAVAPAPATHGVLDEHAAAIGDGKRAKPPTARYGGLEDGALAGGIRAPGAKAGEIQKPATTASGSAKRGTWASGIMGSCAEASEIQIPGATGNGSATHGATPSGSAKRGAAVPEGMTGGTPGPGIPERLLLVLAENAPGTLKDKFQRAGLSFTRVNVYRTVPASPTGNRIALSSLAADGIFLASPTAVEGFVNRVDIDVTPILITIGPSTSAAVRAQGLDVAAEARAPRLEGLLEAMKGLNRQPYRPDRDQPA